MNAQAYSLLDRLQLEEPPRGTKARMYLEANSREVLALARLVGVVLAADLLGITRYNFNKWLSRHDYREQGRETS